MKKQLVFLFILACISWPSFATTYHCPPIESVHCNESTCTTTYPGFHLAQFNHYNDKGNEIKFDYVKACSTKSDYCYHTPREEWANFQCNYRVGKIDVVRFDWDQINKVADVKISPWEYWVSLVQCKQDPVSCYWTTK